MSLKCPKCSAPTQVRLLHTKESSRRLKGRDDERWSSLTVEPCETCLKAKYEEAREDWEEKEG